eukprot:747898-Hanusia_phi.AAC.5
MLAQAMATDPYLSAASNQYTDGTFFCADYVDYAAACDLARPDKSCNNKYANKIYNNLARALDVYSCKSYSNIWTCSDCKVAFKRWLCSQVYKKFVIPDTNLFEEGIVIKSLPVYVDCENSISLRVCSDKYDGFSKLAMGTQWNPPYGTQIPAKPPLPAQARSSSINNLFCSHTCVWVYSTDSDWYRGTCIEYTSPRDNKGSADRL